MEHGLDTVFAISLYKDHQLPISMAIFQSISPSAVHGNRADEESLPFSNTKARSIVAIGKIYAEGKVIGDVNITWMVLQYSVPVT